MRKMLGIALVLSSLLALAADPASAQKRGGVLKFAVPAVKPGLDPAHTSTGDGYMLTQAIFSNLTRIDENLDAKPQLARSWEPNAANSVWTFRLHQGVKFHNGRELTADDVVFSITKSVWNFMEYSHPRVDARQTEALGKTDFAKRKRVYDEVQKILWDEGPWLPVQYVELRDVWLEQESAR